MSSWGRPCRRPRPRALLDAVYLPPVRQGDLLRLVRSNAARRRSGSSTAISATCRPAGTRKSCSRSANGVHVFGAASMGALRAAELDGFGMVGIGRGLRGLSAAGSFEPYRSRDRSRTTTKSPLCTGRPKPASSPSPRPWSTSARPWRVPPSGRDRRRHGRDRLVAARKALHLSGPHPTPPSWQPDGRRSERGGHHGDWRIGCPRASRREGERCAGR